MTEATIYNKEGKKAGAIALPERLFAAKWNADLVHQAVVAFAANARIPHAHVKGRNEVRGGGRKPWAQKGTGRARHGSSRSPIWRGGGITHGPTKDKVFGKKLNRKMRFVALCSVLSKKMKDGEVLFIDALPFAAPKAKDARATLTSLGSIKGFEALATRRKNAALIATPGKSENTLKSFRNFGNIEVEEARNLNPADLLKYRYLVIENPADAFKVIEGRGAKK
jgi:large subunit ribosomal protein L4